jgi:hypothetical protein
MCWQVGIVVNLQKDTPENRAAIPVPKSGEFQVVGQCPKFELWKDTCACDLIKDARGRIVGLVPAVQHFLEQPMVKSVDVLWFWLSEEPKAPPTEKMEFGAFSRKAEAAALKQNTIFRVFKKWTANKSMDHYGSPGADAG